MCLHQRPDVLFPNQELEQLLQGTGIGYRYVGKNVITLERKAPPNGGKDGKDKNLLPVVQVTVDNPKGKEGEGQMMPKITVENLRKIAATVGAICVIPVPKQKIGAQPVAQVVTDRRYTTNQVSRRGGLAEFRKRGHQGKQTRYALVVKIGIWHYFHQMSLSISNCIK